MVSDLPGFAAGCYRVAFSGIIKAMSFRLPLRSAVVALLLLGLLSTGARAATLLVFGDSISAGYGVDAGKGWVALLADRLKQPDYADWTVVNASLSGETTSGGLTRLPGVLQQYQPQLLLIELGGNDGLRGQPLPPMRANLLKMVELCQAAKVTPVILEMRIPSNYGSAYTEGFAAAFGSVAKQAHAPLVPFFMMAIAGDPDRWFQGDGIHPNAAAQPQLLDAVWSTLLPLLAAGSTEKRRQH